MRHAALIALFAVGPVAAQAEAAFPIPDFASARPYEVVYVDDAWGSASLDSTLRERAIAWPDSNLVAAPCPDAVRADLRAAAAHALAEVNAWEPDRADAAYRTVSASCFDADGTLVGMLHARTTVEEHEALAFSVDLPRGERRLFAEANTLDERGWLRAFALEDGVPVLYGFRHGNPNLPHGGRFRLALYPSERRLWFEYAEETF